MENVNVVKLVGSLHFVKGPQFQENRDGRYLRFSIRQESTDRLGNRRHDFILVRAFDVAVQEWIQAQSEGSFVNLEGSVRSSAGSGEIYVLAERVANA